LDVLIANTGNDRMFDWNGEFNSYFVPFSPFGDPTVIRAPTPQIQQFLLDLARASGADQTISEPNAELGLITAQDPQWGDQKGSPRDPQPGNVQAGRDTQGGPENDAVTTTAATNGGTTTGSSTGGTTTTSANQAPIAVDDSATIQQNTSVTIPLLANDSDPDGGALSVVNLTQPNSGTVSLNPDNTVVYTPNAGFSGTDTFTYQASDGSLNSAAATVTVTVQGLTVYSNAKAQAIPDAGTLNSTIAISDAYAIRDLNVQLNITHTRLSDLAVYLHSPSGAVIQLVAGLSGTAYQSTMFDDEASRSITAGSGTFTGSFVPMGNLTSLEGQNVTGTWTLEVRDTKNSQTGALNSWSLIIQH